MWHVIRKAIPLIDTHTAQARAIVEGLGRITHEAVLSKIFCSYKPGDPLRASIVLEIASSPVSVIEAVADKPTTVTLPAQSGFTIALECGSAHVEISESGKVTFGKTVMPGIAYFFQTAAAPEISISSANGSAIMRILKY